VRSAGLEQRITILLSDYRELTGQFDKLVSIEMIEAVGHEYFDEYFSRCSALLRPEGSFVIQAIVMPERRYPKYLRSVDFIQRYIFPGGCLPSVSAMLESVGRTTDFRLSHLEDFAPHYAETLRRWREAFFERLHDVRSLGYSEDFIRMWTYYLCYCEAVFEERQVGVVQVHFDKPRCGSDPLLVGQRAAWQLRGDAEMRASCRA
jgi:cyclopropane-fatty-acyl-phospholipid synthase